MGSEIVLRREDWGALAQTTPVDAFTRLPPPETLAAMEARLALRMVPCGPDAVATAVARMFAGFAASPAVRGLSQEDREAYALRLTEVAAGYPLKAALEGLEAVGRGKWLPTPGDLIEAIDAAALPVRAARHRLCRLQFEAKRRAEAEKRDADWRKAHPPCEFPALTPEETAAYLARIKTAGTATEDHRTPATPRRPYAEIAEEAKRVVAASEEAA